MKTSEVLELPYGIVYGIEGDQTNNADDARACGVHGARVRCKSIYHGEAALFLMIVPCTIHSISARSLGVIIF